MIYTIDGSLESLLCAIFEWFERRPGKVQIKLKQDEQSDAFIPVLQIDNDHDKADRVWKGLQHRLSQGSMRKFYCGFLSELPDALSTLFEFACYVFSSPPGTETNYGNGHVIRLSQLAVMVEREKHRMEAFIRFRRMADGTFYCGIDPDFNVLPLIMGHFKDRYADQRWIIYDIKRNYGVYYDLESVEEVGLDHADERKLKTLNANQLSSDEDGYAALWKNYFKSTNIAARKNTRLHLRHVPKRYWKYLTEKI